MQQTTMKQPPTVISSKDLTYLEDMLAWNLTAAKSAREWANKVTDQEVMTELGKAYEMHKKHYDNLINFLQTHTNS